MTDKEIRLLAIDHIVDANKKDHIADAGKIQLRDQTEALLPKGTQEC